MAKQRVSIPEELAARVLVAFDRTCCVCEQQGAPIQIHHIDNNPANNDPTNLAVLCLYCHHETQVSGGFARQLTPAVVRHYGDVWIRRVEQRRHEADTVLPTRFMQYARGKGSTASAIYNRPGTDMSEAALSSYIDDLPNILVEAYERTSDEWDSNTHEMVRAAYEVAEVVRRMWLQLSAVFSREQFDGLIPEEYLERFLAERSAWHRAMAEPHGPGTGGTLTGVLVARGVLTDLQSAVAEMRDAILGQGDSDEEADMWMERWRTAGLNLQNATKSRSEDAAKLESLAHEPDILDFVAFGKRVRVLAKNLVNTFGGTSTCALIFLHDDGHEEVFDQIEGHHILLFAQDLDGDGALEIAAQYHCGGHTMAINLYRLSDAKSAPKLIPGAVIGSDWPEILWNKRADGNGFQITTKHRNWSGIPTEEFITENYVLENGECVKLKEP